ncbi:MAG: type II toxin-antitoxin system HicA family toxin [Candidatus Komeilibacteria bacterium]
MLLLSNLPGSIKRKKLIKALERLGFLISKKGGDGSHYKITCPDNGKIITIPQKLHKQVLYYIVKEIEKYSNYTWEDIKNEL